MKNEIGVLLLVSAVLFSGCASEEPRTTVQRPSEPSTNHEVTTQQPEQEKQGTNEIITWSSENNEVKLAPVKVTDYGYEGVTVAVNDVTKEFDWSFHSLDDPQVFYTDVTGDGNEEAIIIFNIGKGTGLSLNEVHVLNSKDLAEIKVQSFEEIVDGQIKSHITNNDGTLAIKVKAQGKEYEFSYESPYPDLDQDQLYFGGVVYYNLANQKITSTLGASIGVSPSYVADIHITYKFDHAKNEFIADQIEVVPVDDNNH